jgi:hemoglobin
MRRDIENRDDILTLIKAFYQKLLSDKTISYIFTDVAKIDIETHFPILVDFWEMVLFHTDTYRKNAMQPHMQLNQQTPFEKHHFDTWLKYFSETVDELFEGDKAFLAKERARSIATVMQVKIAQQNSNTRQL